MRGVSAPLCIPRAAPEQEPAHPVGRRLPLIAAGWHNLILCCRCFTWKSGPWLREASGAEMCVRRRLLRTVTYFRGDFYLLMLSWQNPSLSR